MAPLLSVRAQDSRFYVSELTKDGRQAYAKLLKVRMFAVGPVGYGAQTSEAELALKVLLTEREANRALKSLVHDANPEGRLYALVGLRLINIGAFKLEIERYQARPESMEEKSNPADRFRTTAKGQVKTARGCLIFDQPFQSIVNKIQAGDYDHEFKTKAVSD